MGLRREGKERGGLQPKHRFETRRFLATKSCAIAMCAAGGSALQPSGAAAVPVPTLPPDECVPLSHGSARRGNRAKTVCVLKPYTYRLLCLSRGVSGVSFAA